MESLAALRDRRAFECRLTPDRALVDDLVRNTRLRRLDDCVTADLH